MATVYVATDLRLERRVALKVMHGHLTDDVAFQNRFIQEARSAAHLANPHVVNVFDQGQDAGMAYLVMSTSPASLCASCCASSAASRSRRPSPSWMRSLPGLARRTARASCTAM